MAAPVLHALKESWAGGEFSPALWSRTALAKYGTGARLLRNFYCHPHGSISNRPGTMYIAASKYDNQKIRLIPFKYSTLQNYIIELGDYYARFYTNGGQVLTSAYSVDSFTKALLHFEGENNGTVFTDEIGKTVTNLTPVTLDMFEYANDATAQAAYVSDGSAATVSFSQSLTLYKGNWAGITIRQKIPKASLVNNGSQVAVTFKCVNAGSGSLQISKAYIGQVAASGNAWDFDGGQVALKFGGNAYSSVIATTASEQSDFVNFTIDGTKDIIVSFYMSTYGYTAGRDDSVCTNYYDESGDTAATTAPSGYSAEANKAKAITDISVLTPTLQCYSESTIKSQGAYSLKAVASTSALNKKLTRTLASPIDLTGKSSIKFDIRSNRTGGNIKIGIHDSGGTTTEKTYSVVGTGQWETVDWDISGVTTANKNAIDSIIVTVMNADAENTFYLDNMFSGSVVVTSTAQHKLGSSSGYFDGGGYLTMAQSVDFNLEAADFTIDFYIMIHTLGNAYFCGNGAETSGGFGVFYNNSTHTVGFVANGGTRATAPLTPDVDTWYHVAAVRRLGSLKVYIDGVGSTAVSYANTINSIYDMTLGCDSQATGNLLIGYMEEFRISKGIARWTTDFDPAEAGSIPYEIETPYSVSELAAINYTQSADVMFLAHPDHPPQELSRITNTLWTIADYEYTGGAFRLGNGDETKTIASSALATGATTTLTAAGMTFEATHVDALWQMLHLMQGGAVTISLTSATESTSIACGGTWRVITHGTWTGTFRLEKSIDNGTNWTLLREFSSVNDFNANTYGVEDMSNKAEPFVVRVRMTAYSAGTCSANLTTDPYYQYGIVRINSVAVGGVTANATIERSIGSTAATFYWEEGAWSEYRGFPATVEFLPQDRLMFANTKTDPQTIWMTEIGDYYSFARSSPLVDSDAITVNLPAREVNGINALVPLSNLIALTSASEWGIVSSTGAVIAPTSVLQRVWGYEGSAQVRPVVIGNRAIYVQAMNTMIRDLGYELYSDSFTGADISILAKHLFDNHTIADMSYQQNPDRLVWCCRDDGKLLSLTYMREQEVLAWSWHDTNQSGLIEWLTGTAYVAGNWVLHLGDTYLCAVSHTSDSFDDDVVAGYFVKTSIAAQFESVATIPRGTYNEVWFAVKRGTQRYIERMVQRLASTAAEDQIFLDCAITYSGTGAQIITGLGHLEGKVVGILADGNVLTPQVVASGQIDLGAVYTKVHIGIPYVSEMETMSLETNMPDGTLQGRKVRLARGELRMFYSRGGYVAQDRSWLTAPSAAELLQVGGVDIEIEGVKVVLGVTSSATTKMHKLQYPIDSATDLFSGEIKFPLPVGYSDGGRLFFRQTEPLPVTITALVLNYIPGGTTGL